jgi:hypothetical protein
MGDADTIPPGFLPHERRRAAKVLARRERVELTPQIEAAQAYWGARAAAYFAAVQADLLVGLLIFWVGMLITILSGFGGPWSIVGYIMCALGIGCFILVIVRGRQAGQGRRFREAKSA